MLLFLRKRSCLDFSFFIPKFIYHTSMKPFERYAELKRQIGNVDLLAVTKYQTDKTVLTCVQD